MLEQQMAELEKRLAETERELHDLRKQLHPATERSARGLSRGRAFCILGLAGALVAIGLLATTSDAKAPEKPHELKAPLRIIDKAGKDIMVVTDDMIFMRGPLYVQDPSAKTLKPIMSVEGGDRGIVMEGPLYVNDKAGKMIIAVEEASKGHRGILCLSKAQELVLSMGESKQGAGEVVVRGDNDSRTYIGGPEGVTIENDDLVITDVNQKGKDLIRIGSGGVRVFGQDGLPVALMRADPEGGAGYLAVGKGGKGKVALLVTKEAGGIVVRETEEDPIVEIGQSGVQVYSKGKPVGLLGFAPSGSGTGYLAIGDKAGDTVVEAGTLPDGRGIVRAYPYRPLVAEILQGNNIIVGSKK